jgi:hypothetical protein
MKRILTSVATCVVLAGCAQLEQTSYGSWLDRIGQPAQATVRPTPPEADAMRARAAQLHAQADTIRTKLALEPDRVRRVEYMRELRDIGDRLNPLEQALRYGPQPPGGIFGPGA